jgi:hypothetical protein
MLSITSLTIMENFAIQRKVFLSPNVRMIHFFVRIAYLAEAATLKHAGGTPCGSKAP